MFDQQFSGVPMLTLTTKCKVCLNLKSAMFSQSEYREIKLILAS